MHKKIAILLLSLIIVNTSFAIEKPDSGQVRNKEFRSPELNTSQPFVPIQKLESNKRAAVYSKLSALGVQPESAFVDQRSGRFGTLITSIPLLPGKGKDNNLKWSDKSSKQNTNDSKIIKQLAWEAFLDFLESNRSSLNHYCPVNFQNTVI